MGVLSTAGVALERALFVGMLGHVIFCLYLLSQPVDQSAETLARLFGQVTVDGVKAPKVEYGKLCDITDWRHVWANFDTYYLEHLLGWVVGGFVMRSMGSAFLYSLCWEMIEWEFQYVFRVFMECWWDKIFLDSILGNGLGIVIGATLSKKLGLTRYEWLVQGHYLRSFVFMALNYFAFTYGSTTLYAFNDAVDIPEFHPFTFYVQVGSACMMFFAYNEHYDHFSFRRVNYHWRVLSMSAISLTLYTAWQYGLKNYEMRMPDMWLEGLVATLAVYVVLFFINITMRTLPDPKKVWPWINKKQA